MVQRDRPDIIFIRPAQPNDSQALFDVFSKSVTVLCARDYPAEQVQALLSSKRLHHQNTRAWGNVVFVATQNDQVIGFSAAIWDTICAAYVHPQHGRRGVGRALVQALETEARSRRLPKLYVTASLTGEPLYKACGYEKIASTWILVNGVQFQCTKLEKSLRSPEDYFDPITAFFRSLYSFWTGDHS